MAKTTTRSNDRSFLTAPWHAFRGSGGAKVCAAILAGAAAIVVLSQVPTTWRLLGYGPACTIPVAVLLVVLACVRPGVLGRRWNQWLALVTIGFLAWGVLGFLHASGALAPTSMGGSFGGDIIGDRNGAGVLRLIGIGILALGLLAPRFTWRVSWAGSSLAARGLWHGAVALFMGAWRASVWAKDKATIWGPQAWRGARRIIRREPEAEPVDVTAAADAGTLTEAGAPAPPAAATPLPNNGAESRQDLTDLDGVEPEAEELQAQDGNAAGKPVTQEKQYRTKAGVITLGEPGAGGWRLPSISILDHEARGKPVQVDNQVRARAIEEALGSYGIEASVVEINPGPAVTQFGVEPGWVRKYKETRLKDDEGKMMLEADGTPAVRRDEVSRTRVKVDAIANLDKDLAMALAAPSIRIEAPIPGKSMVGIEVPNSQLDTVALRSGMESPAYEKIRAKSKLAFVLGKGSGGQIEVADLAKMPHLLVAGATGSGKSIGLRSLLVCLLMNCTPNELRLLLVDPKRVELVAFNGIAHLACPAVLDVEKVPDILKWAIFEMEQRYKKFSAVGARNLETYNKSKQVAEPLPFLVIAIDELADLMMASPYDVEHSITRLAQLGRATGIHLVVATQRPSVDVVTGLIKANFPTRISFAVSAFVDSRTILDTGGAEKLLGKGDMLFLPQDAPKPKRIQGVFVSDNELERVVRAWQMQKGHPGPTQLPRHLIEAPPMPPAPAMPTPAPAAAQTPPVAVIGGAAPPVAVAPAPPKQEKDPLMPKAREIAEQYTKLSPSLLQRKLKVGYNKAARLMELLEEEGYGSSEDDDEELF